MTSERGRGFLATFEGPEGGGKSTQIKMLAEYLHSRDVKILLVREPGGTRVGDQIRNVLHDIGNKDILPLTEILLLSASRAQLVNEKIKPHLVGGGVVLSDRFFDSTLAYQGYGHGMDIALIKKMFDIVLQGLKVDITFLFDLEPEMGLARRVASGGEWNRFDAMTLEFHRRVRNGYLTLAKSEPNRFLTIDASGELLVIQALLRTIMEKRLGLE